MKNMQIHNLLFDALSDTTDGISMIPYVIHAVVPPFSLSIVAGEDGLALM